jgi:ankyrin repeat protein
LAAVQNPPVRGSAFQTRLNTIVKRAPDAKPFGWAPPEETKIIQDLENTIANSPDLINARGNNGLTPLVEAASKGQLAVVRFLLDNHADVNGTTGAGPHYEQTALHQAASAGHKSIVELLLARGARVNATDAAGRTPLHMAAERGFQAVAQVLIDKGADANAASTGGASPLHFAVIGLHPGMIQLLLTNKADINARDTSGWTPLVSAVNRGNPELVELLLASGADVNIETESGGSALTEIIQRKSDLITRILLEAGANPNVVGVNAARAQLAKQSFGTAPLHAAAMQRNVQLMELLLKYKADPNLADESGRAPLHYVIDHEPALKLLLAAGANPDLPVAQAKVSVSGVSSGETPLHIAVRFGDTRAVQQLLAAKAQPDIHAGGNTPLFMAIAHGGRRDVAK